MGGIAGPIQQVGNTAGQIPQTANVDFGFNPTQNVPFRPQQIPGNLGFPSPIQSQQPQQPGQVPVQGGFGQQPAKGGTLPSFTLPSHYQSPFANYGFDPGLQSYLDQQMYRSYTDGGVGFQYDPTNQTFTGGTMSGTYNPIPLSVMQQAAGGNNSVLSPYFQSKYPQPTGPMPTVKPRPPVIQPGPGVFPRPQPQDSKRGLGGLQLNKFRNRLG